MIGERMSGWLLGVKNCRGLRPSCYYLDILPIPVQPATQENGEAMFKRSRDMGGRQVGHDACGSYVGRSQGKDAIYLSYQSSFQIIQRSLGSKALQCF